MFYPTEVNHASPTTGEWLVSRQQAGGGTQELEKLSLPGTAPKSI